MIIIKKIFLRKIKYTILKRHFFGITNNLRVLPDFIIIGAMKSGTTSLYYNICQHPSIRPAAYDEIGFFDVNYDLGLGWYRSLFPSIISKLNIKRKTGFFLTGEDTPFYFWKEDAALRIKKHFPKIKLIIILRNPIDRAYSNFTDDLFNKNQSNNFEEIIIEEINQIKKNNVDFKKLIEPAYIAKGIYSEQIKIWLKYFDKEQIIVINTEEMKKNPTITINEIFRFLEIPEYDIKKFEKRKQKDYQPISNYSRKILKEFFEPYNEELFNLINKKFNEW